MVDIKDIGMGPELGDGAQGCVYACAQRVNGGPAVFKEYHQAVRANVNFDALKNMGTKLESLPGSKAARLFSLVAWPLFVVEKAGNPVGFLMREIPDAFFCEIRTTTGGTKSSAAESAYLFNSDNYLNRRLSFVVNDQLRYELLADAAEALNFLHSNNIIVGDFSARNLLVSAKTTPRVFLIDADSFRVDGKNAAPSANTPGWYLPDDWKEQGPTVQTDIYKLGLFGLRLFAQEQEACEVASLPTRVDKEVSQLIAKALAKDPQSRPNLVDVADASRHAAKRIKANVGVPNGSQGVRGTPPPPPSRQKVTVSHSPKSQSASGTAGSSKRGRSRRFAVLSVLALITVVGGLAAFYQSRYNVAIAQASNRALDEEGAKVESTLNSKPTVAPANDSRQIINQPCNDEYIVLVSAATSVELRSSIIEEQLAEHSGAHFLDAPDSCQSLRPRLNGKPIYSLYYGPYDNAFDACVKRNEIGADSYVNHLSTNTREGAQIQCTDVAGFDTHQGRYFDVEVPSGLRTIAEDKDVGYGYHTEFESARTGIVIDITPEYRSKSDETIESSAHQVARAVSGASAVEYLELDGIDIWFFAWLSEDGRYKADGFFEIDGDGYAVVSAERDEDMALGLLLRTISSLRPH